MSLPGIRGLTNEESTGVVEGLIRGVLPKGVADSVEVGLGGISQEDIDRRAGSAPARAAEFAGTFIRDTAAIEMAGPMALFGVAALNTVGQTTKEVVNHDPQLSVEHVAGELLQEMITAGVGTALGLALPAAANLGGRVISATGRAIVNKAETYLGKAVAKDSGLELPQVQGAVKDALENDLFTKWRKDALEHVENVQAEIRQKMNEMVAPADIAAQDLPGGAAAQEFLSAAELGVKRYEGSMLKSFGQLTPSKAMELESFLAGEARGVAPNEAARLLGLKNELMPKTDAYLAEMGVSPGEYRALQKELLAQEAVQKSIPTDIMPAVARAGAKTAVAAAGGAVIGEAAGILGLPPMAQAAVAGAVGLKALASQGISKSLAKELAGSAAKQGAQRAYQVGQYMSEFDRGMFSQHYANTVGMDLAAEARNSLKGIAGAAAAALTPQEFFNLQVLANNPQMVQSFAAQALQNAPIPEAQKSQVIDRVHASIDALKPDLPSANNGLAPPGARVVPPSKLRDLGAKTKALTQPQSVVQKPTRAGRETLAKVRPATHALMIDSLLSGAGPNVSPGTRARTILDAFGFDNSVKAAGQLAQELYAPPVAPAPKAAARRRAAPAVHFHMTDTASTAIDDVEEGDE